MARLTKVEAKKHAEAVALLAKEMLSEDEKEFVREHWQESAENVNSAAGAFFTPMSQAYDFALEFDSSGPRIIDLCAGIGNLSAAAWGRQEYDRWGGAPAAEIVCVEMNPQYVEVGRKLLPEATWIQASIFDLPDLGHFDVAISNPPFGKVNRHGGNGPRYTGAEFEYHVIDIAADIAEYGAFILASGSCPVTISTDSGYRRTPNAKYERFAKQTGIELDAGIGVDTRYYADDWHGVKVATEHMQVDFSEWRKQRIAPTPAREVVALAVELEPREPEVDGLDFGDWDAA